ncbi:MAG: Uncharacterized protein of the AP superfamily [Promethearchaeota archaeon CR_4]|nr:MAG: Uncharacterized protein of the AP superfamily [Candidatus Lokiarchaeota archaeon CR_4]
MTSVNHLILLIIDDVAATQFFQYYKAGKLPNLQKLGEQGIKCELCCTAYPAVTLPTHPGMLTGAYSGNYAIEGHGIPHYHWVGRDTHPITLRNYSSLNLYYENEDLGTGARTIFEQFGEGNSLSVFQFPNRGAHCVRPKTKRGAYALGFYYMLLRGGMWKMHRSIVSTILDAFEHPKHFFETNEVPVVSVGWMPGTDAIMHVKGYDSDLYAQELLKCDVYIGELIQGLKNLGYYESTAIAVTSDHGNYKAERAGQLDPWLDAYKLRPYDPKTQQGDHDIAFGGLGFFNFPGHSWHEHPTNDQLEHYGSQKINLYEAVFKIKDVELLYYPLDSSSPDRGQIRVIRKNCEVFCHGLIEWQGHGKSQQVKYTFENEDPLEYNKDLVAQRLLDNKYHNIEEWLAHTHHLPWGAMLVDQLPRYFKNRRAGDFIVSTLGKACYNYEHGRTVNDHVYSHDVGSQRDMMVPLVLGGSPSIPQCDVPFCKTTDIVPTLLQLIGRTPDKTVVGKSLF